MPAFNFDKKICQYTKNKLCFIHEVFYPKWQLWTINQTSQLLQQMNTECTEPLL